MIKHIKNFFRKGTETKTYSQIPIKTGSFLDFALTGQGEVSSSRAIKFYRENSAISTAVDKIASAFEQVEVVLEDDKGNLIKNSPILDFLKNPNGFETWQSFAGALSRHYLITGNTFIHALGNVNLKPLELFAIKPQNVTAVEGLTDSYPTNYLISTGQSSGNYQRQEKRDEVVRFYNGQFRELFHIMNFSSRGNNILGDSPLNAIALDVLSQIKSRTHNIQLLNNGGNPSMIVSFEDDGMTTEEEHEQRVISINEALSGENKAGKIVVVSGANMSINPVGSNNRDMDYARLDEIASQTIYLRYGIPLSLVTVTASTFNNVHTGLLSFYDNTAIPHFNTMLAGLTKLLLPRFSMNPSKFKLSFNEYKIDTLKTRILNELKLKAEMNIETKNELREKIPGRMPKKGGDILYQNVSQIPLGTDLNINNQL